MTKDRNTAPKTRPLGARSLIASLLLRSEPRRMRGARLVQWCGLFEVSEGTARVALSRMVERGELRADDGMYELAGRVGARRATQDWSLDPLREPWTGEWALAVVGESARAAVDRSALRAAMRVLRYAELREGMWTRPDNLPRASGGAEAWSVVEEQCRWWRAAPEDDAAALAETLFDARAWTSGAMRSTRRLASATKQLARANDRVLADAFVAGAAAVAQIRADPLLPVELDASAAVGDELRGAYREYEAAFVPALRGWFREN
jgi:phenylacetic acid degradation operon negative regulatory protein